ncbi:MAG: holo-ACP synthase [Hungatella sp.]|nr:holo-ACP synthase [Hungatella sp.]
MIVGVGTDLIEIARVEKACGKQAFLARIYTREECRQFGENVTRLAGNFAVKEAVAKALGTGFSGFWPRDIQVLRDEKGKPFVNLFDGALKRAGELGVENIHVSITNTKEYAAAFAVAETGSGI